MNNKMTFNEVPKIYDNYRPRYCNELFSAVIGYADLDSTKRAVEVGMGTGQATNNILKTKCEVTAIELGENLVDFSKEKFKDNSNLTIVCSDFESYQVEENAIDLLYSATAFHWIDKTIGYPKAYRILKPGGSIALFWNRPNIELGYEQLDDELQRIYVKYGFKKMNRVEAEGLKYNRSRKLLVDNGFVNVVSRIFYGARKLSTVDYIGLLNTYSDHISLDGRIKSDLESDTIDVINRFGGYIHLRDTIELYMGTKPS